MLRLCRPSEEFVQKFLADQAGRKFTYDAVGATATQPPRGFVVDHTRILLGEGEPAFAAAVSALRRWEQFQLGWLEAAPVETPIQTGATIVIVARAIGLWWLNACQIVYTVNEAGAISRFGFAYGTLPGHAGTGEERFLIEWNQADDTVWYDILAFSRPNHFLAKIGYPMVRMTQKQFGRESSAAMRRAVTSATFSENSRRTVL